MGANNTFDLDGIFFFRAFLTRRKMFVFRSILFNVLAFWLCVVFHLDNSAKRKMLAFKSTHTYTKHGRRINGKRDKVDGKERIRLNSAKNSERARKRKSTENE